MACCMEAVQGVLMCAFAPVVSPVRHLWAIPADRDVNSHGHGPLLFGLAADMFCGCCARDLTIFAAFRCQRGAHHQSTAWLFELKVALSCSGGAESRPAQVGWGGSGTVRNRPAGRVQGHVGVGQGRIAMRCHPCVDQGGFPML
eukprot:1150866-Pelagomonas_calceolata.AAC.4